MGKHINLLQVSQEDEAGFKVAMTGLTMLAATKGYSSRQISATLSEMVLTGDAYVSFDGKIYSCVNTNCELDIHGNTAFTEIEPEPPSDGEIFVDVLEELFGINENDNGTDEDGNLFGPLAPVCDIYTGGYRSFMDDNNWYELSFCPPPPTQTDVEKFLPEALKKGKLESIHIQTWGFDINDTSDGTFFVQPGGYPILVILYNRVKEMSIVGHTIRRVMV
jgi:hypothetical protein